MAEGVSVMELAEDLGFLQPEDVEWTISEHLGLDLHEDFVPSWLCAEVRWVLNPNHERTAAAPYYWPGHPRSFEGESPTAPEGDYDFDW